MNYARRAREAPGGCAISGETYLPNQALIHRSSTAYSWKEENLHAVLSEFGPLPEAGQEQLCRCLVLALGRYQLASNNTIEHVTAGQQRSQLKEVEKTTKRLLRQIENPFLKMWLAAAGIRTSGRDENAINNELRIANDRVTEIVRVLNDLRDRAEKACQIATARMTSGRGGPRRGPTAKGQLIKHAIMIYSYMRVQYPESGKYPGFGGPLLRFVQAVGKLYGVHVRDSEIREAWRTWKSKQK